MRKHWIMAGMCLLFALNACDRTVPGTTSTAIRTAVTTTSTTTATTTTGTTTAAFFVAFEENGGSPVSDCTSAAQMENLPVTVRRGFSFGGWFEDADLTAAFDPESPRTDWTFTLYARWIALDPAVVTFESDGGSDIASMSLFIGETVAPRPGDPSKTGYSFGGWYADPDLTSEYDFSTPLVGNMTLYAKWLAAEVTVTVERHFETLAGSYEKTGEETILGFTGSTAVAPLAPVPGFSIDENHPSAVLSGTVLADGSLVLKVYYGRNDYTISFQTNADLSISSITLAFGSPVTRPSDPIRAGFTFLGWYRDEALTVPYAFSTMPAENITLYAMWLGGNAFLAFDSNDGTPVDTIHAPVESTIVPPTPPTRTGYSFGGWFLDDDCTEEYTSWVMPDHDTTLHAKWIPLVYTIVFEENGGSEVADLSAPYESPIVRPANPTKEGYQFGGWFVDPELTFEYVFTTMPYLGKTIYAKWTSDLEETSIADVLALDEWTYVEVTGVAFAAMNDGQVGYYVFDATGVLFIQDDAASVAIASRYRIGGILRFWNGVPMLMHVTSTAFLDAGQPLPDPALQSLSAAESAFPDKSVYSACVTLRGIVRPAAEGFLLLDPATALTVRLDPRIGGDLSLWLNRYVEIDAIYARHEGAWRFGAYAIVEPAIDDLKKAEMLSDWWMTAMAGRPYYEETPLDFLTDDPFGWGSYAYVYNDDNRIYIDDAARVFRTVDAPTEVVVPVVATVGSASYSWNWTFTLLPALDGTIASYLNASDGEIVDLSVIVTMIADDGTILLEDATGGLFFIPSDEFSLGDALSLRVRRTASQGWAVLSMEDVLELSVVARLSWRDRSADPMTLSEFASLDPSDPTTYGRYVELRGFLDPLFDDAWGEGHGFLLTDDATMSLDVIPVTCAGMESLFGMTSLEVVIRGYVAGDGDGNVALWFEGLRGDVRIPDYTDQERVDMIGTLFARANAGRTFSAFDGFAFLPYHPVLGGSIAWTFPEGFAELYDFDARVFRFVAEPVTIQLGFSITVGAVSKTFVYQTVLDHPAYTAIAGLEGTDEYEGAYVRGLVVYRRPDLLFLQDETGIIMVEEYDIDAYAGDEIVLYARKRVSEYGTASVTLVRAEDDRFLVAILSRDNPVAIADAPWELSDVAANDPTAESSYNRHVTLSGLLRESSEYGGWFEVVRGYDRVLVGVPDDYTYFKMMAILADGPVEVRIPGYLSGYDLDAGLWQLFWTGLEPMEYPTYTDEAVAAMIADWIESEIAGPVPGDTGGFFPPLSHPDLEGVIAYEAYGGNAGLIHFETGFVDLVNGSTDVSVRATVAVGDAEVVLDFVWTVMPAAAEADWVTVGILLSDLRAEAVWLDASILSAFDGPVGSEILVTDGFAKLWVVLPEGMWLYDGAGLVGQEFIGYGSLTRQNGCWKFAVTEYEIAANDDFHGDTFEPLTLGETEAFDFRGDWWWVAGAVELEGVLGRTDDDLYVLRDGTTEIVLRGCYFDEGDLAYGIGLPIRIRGFFAGVDTTNGVERVMVSFTDTIPTDGFPYVLTTDDPQAIAEMMLDILDAGIEGRTFEAFEWVRVVDSWPLFPEMIVEYLPAGDVTFAFIAHSLSFVGCETDQEGTAILRILYLGAVATRTIHFRVNGFAMGTLADLFTLDDRLTEFYLPVTVLYSGRGFSYIDAMGSVYRLEGDCYGWVEPGQGTWLYGKRTTIDGEAGFTYDLRFFGIHYDTHVPAATDAGVADLYAVAAGTLSAYLDVRGILGYDSFMDMFTLSSGGKTVYLRENLPEGGYEAFGLWDGGSITRQDLTTLIGDEVRLKLFVSDDTVRNDILVADFRGYADELALVELSPAETLKVVESKLSAMLGGMTFGGGEALSWAFPYADETRMVSLSYAPASGFESLPIDWINGGIVGLIAGAIDVDVVCTMTYVDESGENPVEYTDTFVFTIHLVPAPQVTVREALWGAVGERYVLEGVVERHFDDWWIILSDETGRIYVDASGHESWLDVPLNDGDVVRLLGTRALYEYEHYVPILDYVVDIDVVGHVELPDLAPKPMTVQDILELDYLCPDAFNQYVSITGTLVFSGNLWYPSFDIRGEGMPEDGSYDIQIWGNTYQEYNEAIYPLVGSVLRVEGYLIGYQYVYQAFDWIVLDARHAVLHP
ncbi:MAG: InlB B-repeat-containing protein [Candidatus Izemoplasmatales bacterium]